MAQVATRQRRLSGGLASLLDSPDILRWCGAMLFTGGLLLAFFGLLQVLGIAGILVPSNPYGVYEEAAPPLWKALLDLASLIFGRLPATLGLTGLPFLLKEASAWPRRLAKTGVLLSVPAAVVLTGCVSVEAYRTLRAYYAEPAYYGSPVMPSLLVGPYFGWLLGVLLVSVAALWVRGLGKFGFLPLGVWLRSRRCRTSWSSRT